MATVITCLECGAKFEREIPEHLQGVFRKIAERLRVCPGCVEHGEREEEREERELAAHQAAERIRKRQAASGIPDQLRSIHWDHLPDVAPKAIAVAQRWARGEIPGLFLAGDVGVGKTSLAAAAAWARLDHGAVRWVDAAELLSRLNRSFGDPLRDDAVNALSSAESAALVLDDIDKARPSEHAAVELYRAIDNRVKAGTQLLVTSNLGLTELRDRYPHGQAIVSRLVLHCDALLLKGPDRRLAVARERLDTAAAS